MRKTPISALDEFAALADRLLWRPIESAPKGKTLLLWGVTDRGDDGHGRKWKMETGYLLQLSSGETQWYWQGMVRDYDPHPTHWMPLPDPPPEIES